MRRALFALAALALPGCASLTPNVHVRNATETHLCSKSPWSNDDFRVCLMDDAGKPRPAPGGGYQAVVTRLCRQNPDRDAEQVLPLGIGRSAQMWVESCSTDLSGRPTSRVLYEVSLLEEPDGLGVHLDRR